MYCSSSPSSFFRRRSLLAALIIALVKSSVSDRCVMGRYADDGGCATAVTVTGCIAQSFYVRALYHCHWIATANPAKLSQPPGIRNTRKAMKANDISSFAMFLDFCVFFCPNSLDIAWHAKSNSKITTGRHAFQPWWSFKNRPGCLAHSTVTL